MHTIINQKRAKRSGECETDGTFRKPCYDAQQDGDNFRITLYVPGVEASGVEIEARQGDLIITAQKSRFVRVNWQALHLENAQRDYRLRLRLGQGFDYTAMQAEIHDGTLSVSLPKKLRTPTAATPRLRQVA